MVDREDHTGSVVITGPLSAEGYIEVTIYGVVSITGDVNVTNSVINVQGVAGGTAIAITGSVVIENIEAGTVNVQTTAGVEVGIGKFETTPVGRLIKNDADAGPWLQSIATDKYGKFFPNSMRGQLHNVPIYVKNATGSAVNLVLKYAIRPLMPDQFSTTTSIPASFEGWVEAAVAKYWDFDSLFIYAENATLSIGMDTPASDLIADCFAYISGAWQWLGYRTWIRVNMKVQTHYAVTVDGPFYSALQPASAIGTLGDVTGNSAAQRLTTNSTPCKAVVVRALAANSGVWRIGDSNVSASRGAELSAGDAIVIAVDDVNKVYGYGVSPDKVSVMYVN